MSVSHLLKTSFPALFSAVVMSSLYAGLARAEEIVNDVAQEIETDVPASPVMSEDIEAVSDHPAATATGMIHDVAQQAGAGHETHGGGGLPQFDFSSWPSQVFWLVVFFVVLYTIFSKAILPAIGGTLESRQKHIEDHIKAAEEIALKAQEIEAKVKASQRETAIKATSEIQSVEQDAKDRSAKALSDYRARYEFEIGKAEVRISAAKEQALLDIQAVVAQLASQMAEKVAGIQTDASQAEAVVKSLTGKTKKAA